MFKIFCDSLIELVEELPDIKNHLQIDFFGYVPNGFNEISSQLDFLKFHGTVSTTKVYEEIQNRIVQIQPDLIGTISGLLSLIILLELTF